MTESGARYPFIIMNTVRSNRNGTRWWSFLDLHPTKEFVFQNDLKVLNKILYGIAKFNKKDNKITLITLKFSMPEYENTKNKNRLRETTIDLLHLMNEYRKKHDLKDETIVHLVDD